MIPYDAVCILLLYVQLLFAFSVTKHAELPANTWHSTTGSHHLTRYGELWRGIEQVPSRCPAGVLPWRWNNNEAKKSKAAKNSTEEITSSPQIWLMFWSWATWVT